MILLGMIAAECTVSHTSASFVPKLIESAQHPLNQAIK